MNKKKRVIAIIPARGNSVRIKNKNLKKFNGYPLIYWTIKTANKSKYINQILITSDSQKILNYCSKFKNCILSKRPRKFSLHESKMVDVLTYELKKNLFNNYDYFVLLQPTSPLRTIKTINESISLVLRKKSLSCVSFYKVKNNFLNLFKINNKKIKKVKVISKFKKDDKYYIPSGDVYVSQIKSFLKMKSFINKHTVPYFIKNTYSDIDYPYEFKLAEQLNVIKIRRNA